MIERGRVWVLQAKSEDEAKEWVFSLDPTRMVEDALRQANLEYATLRIELEQKNETIGDLSASLDRANETVRNSIVDLC